MLAIFSRLRRRISFTALLLAFLSIAIMVVTPLSLERNLTAAESSIGFQKADTSSGMTAAIASLQSGQGPLGMGPVSCSAAGISAQCETAQSGQAASTSSVTGSWTNITPSNGPSPRYGASMAYDSADGYVVLHGGLSSNSAVYLGDTWKFLGGSWTNITSSIGPSARFGASMAYDVADGYLILFGGTSGGNFFGDTWKFLGGSWTNITPSIGPSARSVAPMAFDAADGYVLLFGGFTGSALADTWKFLGGSWTNITPSSGPSQRYEVSMVYDAADGYVVLFGGSINSMPLGDTWKFLGGSWTNITASSSPSPRYGASMAYDVADGYVVLVGGSTGSGDTWKFLGGSWTNITPTTGLSPPPRLLASIAFDAADDYVVLFGGLGNGALSDTWKFATFDYSLSNNGPVPISAGSSGTVTITADLTAGTAAPVTLSCVGSTLPSGITCGSFSANPVTPTSLGTDVGLTVNVASSLAAGSYNFQVIGSPLGATTAPTTVYVTVSAVVPPGIVSTVTVGSDPISAAFDPSNMAMYVLDYGNSVQGTVYVVNGTSVVGTVNSGTPQVYCSDDGNYPIAYDPTDKMIYVSSNDFSSASANGNVSVISGTTGIANVTVGKGPCAIAFDPADGYIYVANSYDNTVSIISGTTVVGTVVVGSSPSALAYDSHNQDMYVVSQSGVSVLSGGTAVGTISLGYSVSSSLAFNPSNNEMYVTSFSCCTAPIDVNLSAIDGTNMVGTVRVGSTSVYGASIVYDPADNDMYVVPWGNSTGTTIVVVSGLTVIGTIKEGPYSVASAFDPATNEMFVTSTYSVLALSGTSVDYNITGIPGPNALAFDTSNNYMYVAYGSHVALIGPVTPFDYTLSISPSSGTVTSGQSIMSTVTATLTAGTAQSVMLGVSAISPGPAVCQSSSGPSPCGNLVFSPTSITPSTAGATSTLTLSTTNVLPVGTYAITISGIPGGLSSSSAVFTVTVNAPSPGKSSTSVSVTCSPSSINVGRFTTCTATVTGNYPSGTVTFASSSTTGTFATSSCTLSAGACSVTYADSATASLTATITASYPGDTNNNPNTGSSSLNISKPTGVIAVGTTTSTLTNGGVTANQASATGISVTITGSTAANGTPVGVSTQTLNAPNSGIPAPSLSSPSYYDVLVTGISSGNAQVCISFSSGGSSTTMQYWDGTSWTTASSITVNAATVCGIIPVSALTGTNVVLGSTVQPTASKPTILGLEPTLFYGIVGALIAIIIVAVALVYRRSRKPKGQIC